jgi:hypothetical protein
MTAEVTAEPDTSTSPADSSAEPLVQEPDRLVQEPERARPRDPERTRVIGARRRLLGMLVALAIGAGVLAYTKLAAWWVILPPSVMLIGYVALLREASRADAERRWSSASGSGSGSGSAERTRAASATTAVRAPVVPVTPPPAPDAEIIDITARVSDDLYDQIADAKLRAVGD